MIDQADKLRQLVENTSSIIEKPTKNARVITITSGKGGVGKTNFTVNLAISLRKKGFKVVIIDADFGLANIEVLFGVVPEYSLLHVIKNEKSVEEILTTGPEGIQFISGGSGIYELNQVNPLHLKRFISSLGILDDICDFILIDTGAGISNTVLNFIRAASETIIITTPEPTSITDAYALLKTLKLETNNIQLPAPKIIINRADNQREGIEIFEKIAKVSLRFLNMPLEHLGTISYDDQLIKAVKRQKPVMILEPKCRFSKDILLVREKILNPTQGLDENKGLTGFMKKLFNIFGN